jgi:hypothetical protein
MSYKQVNDGNVAEYASFNSSYIYTELLIWFISALFYASIFIHIIAEPVILSPTIQAVQITPLLCYQVLAG